MKMKDAIKLGIGFYIGKFIFDVIANSVCMYSGEIQDWVLDNFKYTEYEKRKLVDKLGRNYHGTKYRKQPVTNKKNPIGFV